MAERRGRSDVVVGPPQLDNEVWMVERDDWSTSEVARFLGCSAAAVRAARMRLAAAEAREVEDR